ncbi:MAG: hypothetical protein U5K75_06385 [Ahrensia sp.]|nr:hypothetical protein [Ahrensia sp.]
MSLLRVLLAIFGLAFGVLIVWAILTGDFWQAGTWLTTDPWGIVTLADLYFGFLLSAVIIALVERRLQAVLWILPIPFLGNVWTVIWFVLRLPELKKRFAASAR